MGRDKDPNRELMLKRGSKTGAYDADAPDQWKFDLRHGEGEVKALAWIKSTTIALNHKSPYCVDEHGNPAYLDRMAVDCGWALQTARNIAAGLERNGRIRLEKGKRIWYAAEVPLAHTDLPAGSDEAEDDYAPEEGDQTRPKPATKGGTNNSVHGCCPTYVADFIEKLPLLQQGAKKAAVLALDAWKNEFMADGIAALRSVIERVEDSTYVEIGIPKKRLPKRREPECKWVQLSLLAEPNFVHGCSPEQNGNSVQGMESTSYKVKNGLYKTNGGGASLLCSTTATTKPLSAASSPDLYKESPSVGRSFSGVVQSPAPTDRPTDGSVAKEEIRNWLESNVNIPGFDLEEEELNQIAGTIQTPEHFEQYKAALARLKEKPRGWVVCVRVAQSCLKRQGKYQQVKTMAAASGGADPLAERLRQNVERRKSWQTN